MAVIVWMVDGFKLPVQSVPINTNVVRSNPADGEVYSIQHYVMKFISDMRQDCFSPSPDIPVSSTIKI